MATLATSAGSVGLAVTVSVLVAAVLHAAWNALTHAIADQLIGFALMGAAVTACALGIVLASQHRRWRAGRSSRVPPCCTSRKPRY